MSCSFSFTSVDGYEDHSLDLQTLYYHQPTYVGMYVGRKYLEVMENGCRLLSATIPAYAGRTPKRLVLLDNLDPTFQDKFARHVCVNCSGFYVANCTTSSVGGRD